MDSWIYPALERLAALGVIPSQTEAIRPWTRLECRRQMKEAEESMVRPGPERSGEGETERLLGDLEREFGGPAAAEPNGKGRIELESMYARYGTIMGPALSDGFHLGQTWWNDYGRPLGQGSSVVSGVSFRATKGRYFFYSREEMQLSPGVRGRTAAEGDLLNRLDTIDVGPPPTANQFPATASSPAYLRQRPLALYAGVAFGGYAASFGKQEIFWGPTTMGPLSFSSNAEPTYNLRLVSTSAKRFPIFPRVGGYRVDLVFGKLSGHTYPARPYFNGQKIDFLFGRNLELSFTRWSVLWGVGHPMTLRSLKDNLFSSASTGSTFAYGDRTDPGDRKSGFDFRLHVPGLAKLVTVYADSYADDEVSPLAAPRRVMWSPGIYVARVPGLPHMDLRLEMASSEELSQDEGGLRFLINTEYRDSNTNKGFLLGNAVGRDGRAFEGRAGYWASARRRMEVGVRQNKGGTQLLPGGSTITDVFWRGEYTFHRDWSVQTFVQAERFLIPAYRAGAHHNASGWFQVTWTPGLHLEER